MGRLLFDLKASIPSCLAGATPFTQPHWTSEAERVATIGARMQAIAPAFLEAVQVEGKSFLLKGLQPLQDRVDLRRTAERPKQLHRLMYEFGEIAAWAQLRSSGHQGSANADALIEFGNQRKNLDALLDIASQMAERVKSDWTEFAQHFDAGIEKLISQSS